MKITMLEGLEQKHALFSNFQMSSNEQQKSSDELRQCGTVTNKEEGFYKVHILRGGCFFTKWGPSPVISSVITTPFSTSITYNWQGPTLYHGWSTNPPRTTYPP